MDFKDRCTNCINLKIKNGIWHCTECFNQKCADIDDCPEGITAETVYEAVQKAEQNKVKIVNTAKEKKTRKPVTHKADPEKEEIINLIFAAIADKYPSATITNKEKLIEFQSKDNSFTVDLIKHRPKK